MFVTAVVIATPIVALRVGLAKPVRLGVDAAALGGLLAHELVVNHALLPLHFLVRFGLSQLQNQRSTLRGIR